MGAVKGLRVPDLKGKIRLLGNGEHALGITDPWTPRGAFCFFTDSSDLFFRFVCPCGCGIIHMVRVYRGSDPVPSIALGPRWLWDGNEHAPSLTPSLNMDRSCGWHGWLNDGDFGSV